MDDKVAQAIRTFRQIRQMFEPRNVVLNIDEFSEMEIRPKIGVSCLRLNYTASNHAIATHRCHLVRVFL